MAMEVTGVMAAMGEVMAEETENSKIMWQHLNQYWHAVAHPTELRLVVMALLALMAFLGPSGARSILFVVIAAVVAEYLPAHGLILPEEWMQFTRACLVALVAGTLVRLMLRRSTSRPFEIPLLLLALGWLSLSIYLERTYQAEASAGYPGELRTARVRTLGQFTGDLVKRAFQPETSIQTP